MRSHAPSLRCASCPPCCYPARSRMSHVRPVVPPRHGSATPPSADPKIPQVPCGLDRGLVCLALCPAPPCLLAAQAGSRAAGSPPRAPAGKRDESRQGGRTCGWPAACNLWHVSPGPAPATDGPGSRRRRSTAPASRCRHLSLTASNLHDGFDGFKQSRKLSRSPDDDTTVPPLPGTVTDMRSPLTAAILPSMWAAAVSTSDFYSRVRCSVHHVWSHCSLAVVILRTVQYRS